MFEYMRTSIICRYITTPDPDFALFWEKFSKKNPIFADKTSYFQVGTLKYIDVIFIYYTVCKFC